MIQFNLLPAVKLDYVKAKRAKRSVIVISLLVSAISLGILILLFFGVQIVQKKHSNDLSKDIKSESTKLENTKDLDKILTIQNQLNTLDGLHEQKPVVTRLFDFLRQLTPANVSIAEITVDFDAKTIDLKGTANAISSVNKFADTLKFTTYKLDNNDTKAFSEVVLSEFGAEKTKDNKGTSYGLTLKFDEHIFSSKSDIKLDIPAGKITTRSQTEKPESLFQPFSNPLLPPQGTP